MSARERDQRVPKIQKSVVLPRADADAGCSYIYIFFKIARDLFIIYFSKMTLDKLLLLLLLMMEKLSERQRERCSNRERESERGTVEERVTERESESET